ncbi:MAG: F0F1 ATP synthase subunit delta [Jatrophihabitans sp.]
MIHAASREATAQLETQVDNAAHEAGSDALAGMAGELYQVAELLGGQPQIRRMLGDPSSAPERRTGMTHRLFAGKISDQAQSIVEGAVSLRWSTPWDLTDGIELSGDRLLLELGERTGQLDSVEDELFRFGRIVEANDPLRALLDDQIVPGADRAALAATLLHGKVDDVAAQLLDHAVRSARKRTVVMVIDDLLEQAAIRRHRSTAVVRSAVPLTDQQVTRLASGLADIYHRPIDVRAEVDPSVQGGLVIRVGDEIIDGSVAGRFAAVRTALAN